MNIMHKLIVANWKLNLPDLKSWRNFRAAKNAEVVICPPFPYLACFMFHVSRQKPASPAPASPSESEAGKRGERGSPKAASFKLGAQDCFWEEEGAYTGEVSPGMLKNLGVQYVIIGHSERRRSLGETDEMINKKVLSALRAGLKVILCVGEPLAVRRKGLPAAKRYVANQLRQDLKSVHSTFHVLHSRLVIAYEPIWAIGTGRADKPEEAAAMARFIKNLLLTRYYLPHTRILYGGSVDGKNAKNFLQYKEVDGALVGGASLKVAEFKKILKATNGR